MTKKFELSAYGVEELTNKELVDVEGGLAPLVWALIGWVGGNILNDLGVWDTIKSMVSLEHATDEMIGSWISELGFNTMLN
jgi:lactobin A/cerein 7B family class IIb bacteriocin